MNAYIDTKRNTKGFYAEIVTEQDYHEGGPFAHSHRTDTYPTRRKAEHAAKSWAGQHHYTLTTVNEVAK